MKDQYVGDINDYFKYAILRALAADTDRPLAVCWMLTQHDGSTDGNQISYVDRHDEFRHLDPPLFDNLRALVRSGRRSVAAVEDASLVPATTYTRTVLKDRREARTAYFQELWAGLPPRALVFFDPDNGLEVRSVKKGRRGSQRYLYLDELGHTIALGHIAVVYQHFPRVERAGHVARLLADLRALAPGADAVAIYSSRVAYLIVGDADETQALGATLARLAARWDGGELTVAGCRHYSSQPCR